VRSVKTKNPSCSLSLLLTIFQVDKPLGTSLKIPLQKLSGDRKDTWSVSTSGNWRITFEEEDGYLDVLDWEDYHS